MIWLIVILCLAVLAAGTVMFCMWQNNALEQTYIELANEKIPESFDGLKILHFSDLHNKWFGERQSILRALMENEKPDIIVITGDLIDKRRCDGGYGAAIALAGQASMIAPVYYVTGNHEWQSQKAAEVCGKLKREAVEVLDNSAAALVRGDDKLMLLGLSDAASLNNGAMCAAITGDELLRLRNELYGLHKPYTGNFCILLSHRPELIDIYAAEGVELVLSGHAHGGQVRLPGIGALYAPGQGFRPKYTQGVSEKDGTAMVVSRGLGNSLFPARVFNRPEVVTITLHSAKSKSAPVNL